MNRHSYIIIEAAPTRLIEIVWICDRPSSIIQVIEVFEETDAQISAADIFYVFDAFIPQKTESIITPWLFRMKKPINPFIDVTFADRLGTDDFFGLFIK